jgi:cation diffusion facilitator CzcD-associated flavoprotein CzcO
VQVKDLVSGTTFTDTCDFLAVSTGILNAWQWPDIPGLMDFKGKLMHTANYDTSYDLKDKEVALIGAGSTGIQVLPTIQPIVKRVDHYMRSKTWVAPGGFAGAEALKRNPSGGNCKFKHLKTKHLKTLKTLNFHARLVSHQGRLKRKYMTG